MMSHSLSRLLAVLVAIALAAGTVVGRAATVTWDADGTTGGVSDGSGVWLGANQWWNGTSNVTWTSGDDAVFGVSGTGGTVTLSATTAATSLAFNTFSGTYTLGTSGQTLTLGSGGLTMNAGAGAVTLLSPVTLSAAQSWTNNSASLLTTSAALANGGNLLTVAGSGNATLAAILGTGGLTKSGAGTLTLAGANTYTGGTIVSGGTLTLAPGTVSGNFNGVIRDSLTVSSGATVNATQGWSLGAGGPNSALPTSRSVTDITLTGGTLNITLNTTTKGGMSPTTITMTAGWLTGQPVQWYYGNSTTVSLITNASGTTSTVSAPVALRLNKTAGAGSLTFNVAAGTTPDGVDLLISGAISDATDEGGGGRIIKSGAGTMRMTAINSYTEGTTVQAGTLSLGNGGANGVIRGSLAIQPGARVVASAAGWSLGYGGTRAGAAFPGNSVTAISINGGTLEFTDGQAGAGLAASDITLTGGTIAGASFGWIESNTLTPTLRTLASATRSTLQGGISLRLSSSGTLTVDTAAGSTPDGIDLLVSGPISQSTGGVLAKTGAGTMVLAGVNTSTGGLIVSGGTVAIQGSLAPNQNFTIRNATLATSGTQYNAFGLTWTSGTTTINAGGLLFAGNATNNAHNLFDVILAGGTMNSGTGSLNGALANWYVNGGITATGSTTSLISASLGRTGVLFGAPLAMTVDAGSTLNVSGPIVNISGNNPLTKSGDGRLVLSGTNTFSGGLTLSAGQLDLNASSSLGSGAFTIAGGTIGNSSSGAVTLSTNNTQTWNSDFTFAGPNNLNLGTGGVTLGANRTVTVASGLLTVGGGISGTAGLTKSGGGELSLDGANSYSGGTIVNGGTLALAPGSVSGNFNGVIRGSLAISNGATVNATQGWSLGAGGPNSSQPTTQSVTDITLTGGTLNFTSNVLKGGMSPTTITMTGGSLTGEVVEWYFGNSSTVSLVTNPSGTTSTISAPINLRLNKTAGAGVLTFDVAAGTAPNNVDLLVTGAIGNSTAPDGGGRIVKTGAGRMVLSATNTFTGSVTVSSGTFEVAGTGVLGSGNYAGAVAIEEGARFVYGSSATQTLAGVLSGSGGLTKTGAGTLTFGNVQNSYTGGTVVDGGTLTLGNGAANGNIRGTLTINPGATVIASATNWSLGFGGTRAGAGYSGNSVTSIAINGGLLSFTNAASGAGLAANEIVLTGGTIGGGSFGWINSNTLTPTLRTLASSARSTLSGGISLRLSTSGTLTFDVATGATPDGIDLLVSGPITTAGLPSPDNNGGNLVKAGAGTLALSGVNTFTGSTLINAGRLQIDSSGSLTATSGITINGGELKYNSATALARPLTFTAGTISGTGAIGTAVTVAANDILSPGNSPGAQSYTAGLTWSGSGSYLWELNDLSGTAGVNWDVINISGGTFDLSGLSAESRFILDLTTLTGSNTLGPLDVAYDGGNSSFLIASYTSLSTPLGTAALTDLTSLFDIRLDNWASPTPALPDVSVRINSAANGLELVIVPEPGALALAAIGAIGVAWAARRRRLHGERATA